MKKKKKYIPKYQLGDTYPETVHIDKEIDNKSFLDEKTIDPNAQPSLQLKPPTPKPFVDWVNAVNVAATGVTNFANSIQSGKDFRREQQKYYDEYQNPQENNFVKSDTPAYMAYGGVKKYPYGGGPLTAEGAKEILRDGTVHGRPLTKKQKKYFGYIAGGGSVKKQYGGHGLTSEESNALKEMNIDF